MTRKVANK